MRARVVGVTRALVSVQHLSPHGRRSCVRAARYSSYRSSATARRLVAFYVGQHNVVIPHAARGSRPDPRDCGPIVLCAARCVPLGRVKGISRPGLEPVETGRENSREKLPEPSLTVSVDIEAPPLAEDVQALREIINRQFDALTPRSGTESRWTVRSRSIWWLDRAAEPSIRARRPRTSQRAKHSTRAVLEGAPRATSYRSSLTRLRSS